MKKIGIISDTHAWLHPKASAFFSACDEIWHAGDAGNLSVLKQLAEIRPLRAVHGNVDGQEIRVQCPEILAFASEDVRVLMVHIGGRPGKYTPAALEAIRKYRPDLFVCGHSHILKVQYDKLHKFLYVNPGAAGKYGFHQRITFLRLTLEGKEMKDMEVFDAPKYGSAEPVG